MRTDQYLARAVAAATALLPLGYALPTSYSSPEYGPMKVLSARPVDRDAIWTTQTPAHDAGEKVEFSIHLRAHDQQAVHQAMDDIADPNSPRYRQFLSADEAEYLTRAHEETSANVHAWLADSGAENIQGLHGNRTITFQASVATGNRMFDADYTVHSTASHPETGRAQTHRLSKSVSLPAAFHEHVWRVSPGTDVRYVAPHSAHGRTLEAANGQSLNSTGSRAPRRPPQPTEQELQSANNCSALFTPECVRQTYNVPPFNVTQHYTGSVSVGVLNLRPNCSNRTDIATALSLTSPQIPSTYGAENVQISVPGMNPTECDSSIEPNLDLQALLPIVYPMKVYDFEAQQATDEGLFGAVQQLGKGDVPRPDILSVSYGNREPGVFANESDYCAQTNALGLQGTTLLASSGDSGSQLPSYPCLCPGWTCVGATETSPGAPPTATQVSQGFNDPNAIPYRGGGGFAPDQAVPLYQQVAVGLYAAQHTDPVYGHVQNNRGFPDIAAQGQMWPLVVNGTIYPVGGTSLSSPMVAGILALVNSQLVQAGGNTLGSVNPIFYAHPEIFKDVVKGNNYSGNFSKSATAYPAMPGWDPSTGLGTLMFDRLTALVGSWKSA